MYNSPEYNSILSVAKTYLKEVADPKYDINQTGGKTLGSGAYGQTKMGQDKDSVIKEPVEGTKGRIGKHEMTAMETMDGTPGFPRLLQKDVTQRKDGEYEGKIAVGLAKGKPLKDAKKEMTPEQGQDTFRKLIRMRKEMHQKGISHNDMHDDNIFVDDDNNATIIDFGEANVNPVAALGEALGLTNELMPSDLPFDDSVSNMQDPEIMEILQNNHKRVMDELNGMEDGGMPIEGDRLGRTQFDLFKMMPHGKHNTNMDHDAIQSDVSELDNENVFRLIDMYYEGLEDTPAGERMARAFGELQNVRSRVGRGGNLRKGEVLVPDKAIDFDD